ncbi:hypothetical protein NMG60_11022235 [Bertholletia excelsa]
MKIKSFCQDEGEVKLEMDDHQKALMIVSGLKGTIAMNMEDNKLTVTGDINRLTIKAKVEKNGCVTTIVSLGMPRKERKDLVCYSRVACQSWGGRL